jgi:putative ABC transport system permease protein
MRSMARCADGSDQALVEVKAVDAAYPLFGALETEPAAAAGRPVRRARRRLRRGGARPAVRAAWPFAGDRIKLGGATFELRAGS